MGTINRGYAQDLDANGKVIRGGGSGALTDRSGTITTGGTAQPLAAANTTRRYFFFQNNSAGDLWLNFGATAVLSQPSTLIPSGGSLELGGDSFISNQSISVIGATTGQAFTAKEG